MAQQDRQIVLIAHDIRSTHNVGALLRTAECMGITHVYLTGYTPHPLFAGDTRLPHIAQKLDKQISKTALGAETSVAWSYVIDPLAVIRQLQADGYHVAALEQTTASQPLPSYVPTKKITLVLGREVEGVADDLLRACDLVLEIPQFGHKESLNVVQAAAMVLYHCRFSPF